MELDDLKHQWADDDRKLDRVLRIGTELLREARMRKAGSPLKWAFRGILFEQLTSIPAVVLLGIFIGNHPGEPRYLIPAIVLDVFAVASIVSCAFQLSELHGVDYGGPIVTIQKKLEGVRILRLRTIRWALLLGPVLWVPFTIVALQGVLGLDGYILFPGGWLLVNLAAGAVLAMLLFLLSNALAARMHGSGTLQRVLDSLAGHNLSNAAAFLAQLKQIEEEAPAA